MESIGLGKVLPGAVNDGGCTFSQGYYENRAFIVSRSLEYYTISSRLRIPLGVCFWTKRHNSYRATGMGSDVVQC